MTATLGSAKILIATGALVLAAGLPTGVAQAAGAAAVTAPPSASAYADAGALVQALVEAMQRNDGPAIRALFAPDAAQAYGDGRPKSGAAFFSWLESDIISREGRVEDPQLVTNGNEVIVTGRFRNNRGYSAAANFRILVEDGRIVSWQMRY